MDENPIRDNPANVDPVEEYGSEESEYEDELDEPDEIPDNPAKEIIGKYLLYLRGCTRATNNDVINILHKMQEVVRWYVSHCVTNIQNRLREGYGLRLNDFINVDEILNEIDCTQGLHSIRNQDTYFQTKFNIVQPHRVELGENFAPYGTPTIYQNQPMRQKKDEFIQVPISEVLPRWLEKGTFGNILRLRRRGEGDLSETFVDGTHYQNHTYVQRRPNCKLIKLYYDEVDMCDAVGSKSCSINKLGMFYWMDEDISPEYKSQLKFINLAGIISNPHINNYGMNSVLKHIVSDVQALENGVHLSTGEEVYGTVSVLIGDNLAIHQLCGFRESFSARHPCRVCMATMDQVRTMCNEDENLLRRPDVHDRQANEIEAAVEDEQNALRTEYGINRRSVLNDLEGFHVLLSTPPDTVHDDNEGFFNLTAKLFLNEICFTTPLITLHDVNERIKNFDYGYTEKSSKPSMITQSQLTDPNQGLKQTASQMAQLVVMLPLLIADKVPQDWPSLRNFLKMLEIMLISNSDKIRHSEIGYLKCCISEYLETFKTIYRKNLTPKQHFLLHRPRKIDEFGPLNQYRTMRPESKHQFFKRIAQCMRTYKNLPLTLARKHQLYQANILLENIERDIITGPIKWVPIDLLGFKRLFPEVHRLHIANWVKINGIKYVPLKCILAVGYTDSNIPIFVALHAIVWRNNVPLFVCHTVEVVEHNVVLMAYEIQIEQNYVSLSVEQLLTPDVFHVHRMNNRQFVILKKALGNLH